MGVWFKPTKSDLVSLGWGRRCDRWDEPNCQVSSILGSLERKKGGLAFALTGLHEYVQKAQLE